MNPSFKLPTQVIHEFIQPNGHFPGNSHYPLVLYKQVFAAGIPSSTAIQRHLKEHHWVNSWVDSIYDYHHYHSNTHEALVIIAGHCTVQIGGPGGTTYDIETGDVIIFPAGVAHKNISSSTDFKCIGSYPNNEEADMCCGLAAEHPKVDGNINQAGLPKSDPIYGLKRLLFDYWE